MKKILRIIGITALILLVIFLSTLLFLLIKMKLWEREFQSKINQEYLITELSSNENLYEKITQYTVSREETEFVTFTPKEIGNLIYQSLDESTGENQLNISAIYIIPSQGKWEVCGRVKLENFEVFNPWICVYITKDEMETAQLYVSEFTFQGIDVGKIYKPILVNINKGIAEALVTVNENGFVGRTLENIELSEKELILKGSQY
jgi:hypothetical protein